MSPLIIIMWNHHWGIFIPLLFQFLVFWPQVLKTFYVLIWAVCQLHKACLKVEKHTKKPVKCFWWLEKNSCWLWSLLLKKILPKKWKRNQRLCGLFLLVLLHCYTVYCRGIFCTFLCPNMVKWHNSGIINAFN